MKDHLCLNQPKYRDLLKWCEHPQNPITMARIHESADSFGTDNLVGVASKLYSFLGNI